MHREELYVRLRWPFRSAETWYAEYRRAWKDLETGPVDGAGRAYDRRVLASWGLSIRAPAAMPFALEMLRDRNPEIRADATSVLERLADDSAALEALIGLVESDPDLEPVDAAVEALGRLRAQAAIPALAKVIRDERADGDTQFAAAMALGRIVGKRFPRGRTVEEARAWLDRNAN
ncbi:MAG TPA: hypothetical protein VKB07_09375 [Gaiellaceae bacterium]|nr:hypothetical protein [Gaiellaceae bacterium]